MTSPEGATVGETLALETAGLDDSGAGLAVAGPLEVHVPGALPGEAITARLAHRSPHRRADGRHDAWATLLTVDRPAPTRVAPVCAAFGACGGCVLQHLDLSAQQDWKTAKVAEALATVPRMPPLLPCVPSPAPIAYRNQAKYVVGRGAGGGIVLGAYAPRSHDIVDLAGCQLIEPALATVAHALPALLDAAAVVPYDERKRTGQLRYVVLRANARGEVLVALITVRAEFSPGAALAARLLAEVPGVVGVVQNVNPSAGNVIFGQQEQVLGGRARLEETIAGVAVELAAPAFLQLNRGVAAIVYQAIAARIAALPSLGQGGEAGRPCTRLVDVYSGVGAIAFSLQALAEEIVAIEENEAATAAGSAAAERAGLTHLRFVTADAAAGLHTLDRADVVVLNPPRAGASAAAVAAIVRLQPRLIVYLSCNPATLARDLALFTAPGAGFEVTQAQPFDMLPHTTHVETFAVLSRDR